MVVELPDRLAVRVDAALKARVAGFCKSAHITEAAFLRSAVVGYLGRNEP